MNVTLNKNPIGTHKEGKFILTENFVFYINGNKVIIGSGFESDGASVPRIFSNIYQPFGGNYFVAAIIHDFIYGTHILSKDDADEIFKNVMIQCGVSKARAYFFYYMVSWFGSSSYDKDEDVIEYNQIFVIDGLEGDE